MDSIEYWQGVFIADAIAFVESRGRLGEVCYTTHFDGKKHKMTWHEFMSEAVLHDEVAQAMTLLMNDPCTETRKNLDMVLVCLANRLYRDDVAEFNLNQFLEG